SLAFYDLGSGQLIGELRDYSRKQCIPLCLAYVEKPADDREAVVIGDDTGGISVFTCSAQWLACDGRSPPSGASTSSSSASSGGNAGHVAGSSSAVGSIGSSGVSVTSGSSATTTSGIGGAGNANTASSAASSGVSGSNNGGNPAGSAVLEAQGFSSRVKFQKHTDWVTRVKWVHDMRAVVATSLDATVSILDVDRLVVKFEYTKHRKGVFDLAWCASTRLIASCGMERDIHIWNPYSAQRAVATLKGHTSSVLHLASDDDNFQLVSAAADNTVKVWDVRNHRCLQTFVVDRHRSTPSAAHSGGSGASASTHNAVVGGGLSAENRVSALLFDGKQPCLMTATTHLTRWAVKEPDGGGSQAADDLEESPATALAAARKAKARGGAPVERPLRLASYNGVFHQVVTAAMDAESAIKTWSAETGDEISSFVRGHSDSPVTAIAFDHAGRRLLTGAHDGEQLNMWNFSNGALVKQFLKKEAPLLSSLLSSPPTVAATLLDDPSALAVGAGEASAAAATVGPPRKRKVRDIMLLPPSFGMDHEGHRGDPAIMASAELPSPTRTRLLRGQDCPTPVPPIMPQHPDATSQTARDPSPRPRSLVSRGLKTSRTTETSRYRQQEVTSILDIERNLRVGMGDFICQRFVCSVGWDRRLYVWADKNDESEALPVHILPSDSDEDEEDDGVPSHDDALEKAGRRRRKRQHHTMDVLALAYLPPAYVATAGLDGQVLLWSLNSGELVTLLYQSSGAIETLCYAEKLELLLAAGESGLLVCFDRSMTLQAELPLDVSMPQTPSSAPESSRSTSLEPITTIRCDKANTHLVSGDAAGCVKVWELRVARDHEGVEVVLVCVWHLGRANPSSRTGAIGGSSTRLVAFSRRVVCADFVENLTRVSELFLMLSCADGDVSLWTLDGVQVGSFGGRHRSWQLGKPATYAATQSCCDWSWLPQTGRRASFSTAKSVAPPTREELDAQAQDEDEDEMDESAKNDVDEASLASPETTFFVKCGSIAALNGSGSEPRESFLLEDTMPKPGEVWVCVSGHRSRAATQNVGYQQGGNEGKADTASPSTDEVSGRANRKSVALSTVAIMSRRRSPFSSSTSSNEPKTLASLPFLKRKLADASGEVTDLITVVKAKPDKKTYALVGADGKERGLQPLNESMSIARHKLLAAFRSERRQSSAATVASVAASSRRRSQLSTAAVAFPPEDRRTASPGLDMSMTSLQAQMQTLGVGDPALSELLASSTASPPASRGSTPEDLALASSVGMGARTLPLIRPREKRVMGGLLPKRSSVRSRLDPAADVRRIHNPDDIPKNFRAVLQHKREHKDVGFEGILPQ
ncbi:hypothetical protein BBJ28_00023995, partial [Nothophytophthora sp. Chile5]